MSPDSSEKEQTEIVYQIAHTLVSRGLLSRPEDLAIQREVMEEIKPLGAVGSPERIDLSQLETAAREGRFWFAGPISGLKVVMNGDPLQGNLELGIEKMTYTKSMNTLNFKDFEALAARMKELADQLGLSLAFGKGAESYDVTLVVSYEVQLSAAHFGDFLDKILLLQESTEDL